MSHERSYSRPEEKPQGMILSFQTSDDIMDGGRLVNSSLNDYIAFESQIMRI